MFGLKAGVARTMQHCIAAYSKHSSPDRLRACTRLAHRLDASNVGPSVPSVVGLLLALPQTHGAHGN